MTIRESIERHYEGHLGDVTDRYRVAMPDGADFEVVRIADCPCRDAACISSIGMADARGLHLLQEILLPAYNRMLPSVSMKLVGAVVQQVLATGVPLKRGDILGPAGPLMPGTNMEALYVCPPTYFDPELLAPIDDGHTISFLWLVPIYSSEALWARTHGFDAFESALETHDPDLLDLCRSPLSLGK